MKELRRAKEILRKASAYFAQRELDRQGSVNPRRTAGEAIAGFRNRSPTRSLRRSWLEKYSRRGIPLGMNVEGVQEQEIFQMPNGRFGVRKRQGCNSNPTVVRPVDPMDAG